MQWKTTTWTVFHKEPLTNRQDVKKKKLKLNLLLIATINIFIFSRQIWNTLILKAHFEKDFPNFTS